MQKKIWILIFIVQTSSCINFSSLQTAKIVPPGKTIESIGLGAFSKNKFKNKDTSEQNKVQEIVDKFLPIRKKTE